uniref:Integrase catalytic domain-containing protein n=1 Tax=Lactuca sativa TaxID=4236 RepID=A0A9R1VI75_LACSA|nr:hypothetical protein LSAT_V11C500270100 [Lactuca sativa]
MADDKSIMEQVHELQVMVNKLKALSISIPELFQVGVIIAKLPPSWKDFSKRMMHKSEEYSLDDLMKHLHIEEETRIRDKRGKVRLSVHHVSAGGSSHKGKFGGQNKKKLGPKKQSFKKPGHHNPNSKPKRTITCHICGEIGHYARECKDRKSGPVAHVVEQVTDMVASVNLGEIFMISSLTRAICARGWFVDTGATVHVCGQRENFRTYRPMPHGTVVVCANGHRDEVLGRGDVRVKFTRGILTRGGKRYFITFCDDFSRYLHVYLLRSKDDAFDAFKRYKAEVENQLERHIKILRSDRGREYFNLEFDTFCEENGIKHERTSPYTPQHNGLAERKNRTLCEMVNCMLNQSGQPNNVWGEALLTAFYVHNRITSRVIPTSPYKLWKGRKPNLDYLKVKAYRLLDIDSGVVVESRYVEFFEDKFFGDEENSSHTTSTSTSREILPHPPIMEEPRRSTRARIEKSFGDDFYSYFVEGTQKKVTREVIFSINLDDDPKTFTEAMMYRDASLWKEAINDEMDSIMGNGTWELADLPMGRNP